MKNILTLTIGLLFSSFSFAQIQFKLNLAEDGKTYQIFAVAEEDFVGKNALTSSAQITLKAPRGTFEPSIPESALPVSNWKYNVRVLSPAEAEDFDYFSFSLAEVGARDISYVKGEETLLFTIKNEVECTASLELIRQDDAFMPPNSRKANIGNQITVLGAGGNAFTGIIGKEKIDCNDFTPADLEEEGTVYLDVKKVFPVPTYDHLNVQLNWLKETEEPVSLVVQNLLGVEIFRQAVVLIPGQQQHTIRVKSLPEGMYFLQIQGVDWNVDAMKFTRMY